MTNPQKVGLWSGVAVVAAVLLALPFLLGGEEDAGPSGRPAADTLTVTATPVREELLEDAILTTAHVKLSPKGERNQP